MSNTPLTRRQGSLLVKMVLIGLFVNLCVVGYVFYQSYMGREDVVMASLKGCDRSKKDREANAAGWRTAERARLSTLAKNMGVPLKDASVLIVLKPHNGDPPDLVAARKYNGIARGLEIRSRIRCKNAFPKARLLP